MTTNNQFGNKNMPTQNPKARLPLSNNPADRGTHDPNSFTDHSQKAIAAPAPTPEQLKKLEDLKKLIEQK